MRYPCIRAAKYYSRRAVTVLTLSTARAVAVLFLIKTPCCSEFEHLSSSLYPSAPEPILTAFWPGSRSLDFKARLRVTVTSAIMICCDFCRCVSTCVAGAPLVAAAAAAYRNREAVVAF